MNMKNALGLTAIVAVVGIALGFAFSANKSCADDRPCCWYVPKGQPCVRCRDASVKTAYPTRPYCRVRWEVFYDRINNRCIRYGRDQWLCPVETCERV